MKQVIIARKDLNMSPCKLAAQVSHASMAFITAEFRWHYEPKFLTNIGFSDSWYCNEDLNKLAKEAKDDGKYAFYYHIENNKIIKDDGPIIDGYSCSIDFDKDTFENWINGSFTKVVCEAKTRNKLLKVIDIANELGLVEGKDYFLIKDNCCTELTTEEVDEKGIGRCLTCIGFRPLPDNIASIISKKFQLYTS